MLAVKSLGKIWGPAGKILTLYEESGNQDSFEVCRKILRTSRIAGKSLGRVIGPAGLL